MHKRRFLTLLGSSAVAFSGGAVAEENSLLLGSRAEAEVARVPPGVLLLQVLRDGVLYRYVRDSEGTALTSGDGSRWSPAETPSLLHWGVAADGETDDAGPMTEFIVYLDRGGREGHVPSGTYAVSHVRLRSLQRGCIVRCHTDARIIGIPTTEHISTVSMENHKITSFPVTKRGVQVVLQANGEEVNLSKGSDYEISGNEIRWRRESKKLSVGAGSLRIVSASPMIELGCRKLFGCRVEWHGGVIDNSKRGFIRARASGSGLSLVNFSSYIVAGVKFQGARDYTTAYQEKVTDTALTVLSCSGGLIIGNRFSGQADAGIYLTGGNQKTAEDNGVHHLVQGNHFVGCRGGVTSKRDARGTKISENTFEDLYVAASFYNTLQRGEGGRGIIAGNEFIRSERRAIDLRATRGVIVTDNIIRDVGGLAGDGARGAVAIEMRGVRDALVADNLIFSEERSAATSTGMSLSVDTLGESVDCARVHVRGNTISGFATGIRERGEGRDNLYHENVILGATRPMDVPAGRSWQYRDAERAYEGPG